MKLIRKALQWLEGLYRVYSFQGGFHLEEQKLQQAYYRPEAPRKGRQKQQVVVMVDGRVPHGGLSDRIRGIASIYDYCHSQGIDFFIHYRYPFALEQYLEPATVDWRISQEDLTFHPEEAVPVMLLCHLLPNKHHLKYLKRVLKKYPCHQIHIYTNTQFADRRFKENFAALFQAAPPLHAAVSAQIPPQGRFVAMVFRFQQLLGDFKEGDYKILSSEARRQLIECCIGKVAEIAEKKHPGSPVLITSDSVTFLETIAQRLPYVFTIPGKVVHMDYTLDANYKTYLKSFVDMLTLSHAEKIYLLKTGEMYKSGFAKRAAKVSNTAYEEIIF